MKVHDNWERYDRGFVFISGALMAVQVKVPRVAESAVTLECRLRHKYAVKDRQDHALSDNCLFASLYGCMWLCNLCNSNGCAIQEAFWFTK